MAILKIILWTIILSCIALAVLVVGLALVAPPIYEAPQLQAQTVSLEFKDPEDGVLRLPSTLGARLGQLLGARAVRIKPAVGTELPVVASAYATSKYQTDNSPCITASGVPVSYPSKDSVGTAASNILPFGTVLLVTADIPGYEKGALFMVIDRMNARYNNKNYIDLLLPSTYHALLFGRQRISIKIVDYGTPGQYTPPTAAEKKVPAVKKTAPKASKSKLSQNLKSTALVFEDVFRRLLSARLDPSVNRFDVDCSKTTT